MSDRALIIPAAYTKLSTLADGTLRIVLDIEPRHMADAFALFAKPGAPVAIARLTDEAAVAADQPAEPAPAPSPAPERRQTPLASKVAMTVDRIEFFDFLFEQEAYRDLREHVTEELAPHGGTVAAQSISEEMVKRLCGVSRKRDIVAGSLAGERWKDIWFQFQHWQSGRAA
ncbi:hypothetical protein [Methylobacterium oryzisoli]|uniref:hypothetical protein n=1 Tax=Methylobacterium oryzisoli TaxID=3385502 RepID=UPI003891229B